MNKIFRFVVIFLFLSGLFLACRKDDICTEEATPKTGLGFYDLANPDTLKSVDLLTVIALPDKDTLIKKKEKSKIHLPFNVNADTCSFILVNDTNPDTLTFHYTREDVFVSQACGYRTIFHNLSIDLHPDNNLWIQDIIILYPDIITSDSTYVKILH